MAFKSYAEFLSFLLSVGPKLRQVWPAFKAWVDATRALYDKVSSLLPNEDTGVLSQVAISGDVAELEIQVGLLVSEPDQLFEGNFLRVVYQLLQDHPEITALLISLLKRLVAGS